MPAAIGAAAPAVPVVEGPSAVGVRVLPGLLLAGLVGLSAHVAARMLFPYALAVGFEVPLAMLVGLLVVNLAGAAEWALPGIRFTVRYVLGAGIVLLGLRLNLASVAEIGAQALLLVLGTIAAGCVFAVLAGRRLGVRRPISILLGVGASICGNSAILAAAPVVGAADDEVSFALATVTVIGTLGVFVFPLVGHALGLNVLTYGVWTGASVPDTAQTIASSAAYSTVARDVATVVKLVRTALLAPVLVSIAWSLSRTEPGSGGAVAAARRGARRALPFFLVGFVALAVVRTERLVDPERLMTVDEVTRACFVVALAALGLQTRLEHLRAFGPRPFALGLATTGLLAGGSLSVILAFGIGPARTHVTGAVDPRPQGTWTAVCEGAAAPAPPDALVGLGSVIGRPRGCVRPDAAGDGVERTTRGVAVVHAGSGIVTFSDGDRSWRLAAPAPFAGPAPAATLRLVGRLVATGVPGAGAIAPVGSFHPGGPIVDNRGFAAATRPGRVLDPTRLLVASTANFGEPRADGGAATGSILSLATNRGGPLAIPPAFAAAGGQARGLRGAVQVFTADSPAFLNRLSDPHASTASLPGVADPRGISVNNAFGRPWFANAPAGARPGAGAESVLDPDGRPLANPPSDRAGGVFAGVRTDRSPQLDPGALRAAAVGNALLGASPDSTGRAVFAVATADGGIAQVHVEDGVDGLAPPGTIAPLPPGGPSRVGMVFNWVPDRFLYVSDPMRDAIVKLHLDDDFHVFRVVDVRRLAGPWLSEPVDLAPAVPEVANPAFSSNTTLAGGADIYVANRGSGTIVRLRQDGRVRAIARVVVPGHGVVGPGLLDGIAVAPDASRIWVTLAGRSALSGSIVELPAFGAPA